MTLVFGALAALILGMILAVSAMYLMGFRRGAEAETADAGGEDAAASASASADVEDEPDDEASASASAPAGGDPAAAARASRVAALRKKIKQSRARQLDKQCAEYRAKRFPAGYVFSGGTDQEEELVAGASGCVPLAQAEWYCCAR
jgi:hypothetical protein